MYINFSHITSYPVLANLAECALTTVKASWSVIATTSLIVGKGLYYANAHMKSLIESKAIKVAHSLSELGLTLLNGMRSKDHYITNQANFDCNTVALTNPVNAESTVICCLARQILLYPAQPQNQPSYFSLQKEKIHSYARLANLSIKEVIYPFELEQVVEEILKKIELSLEDLLLSDKSTSPLYISLSHLLRDTNSFKIDMSQIKIDLEVAKSQVQDLKNQLDKLEILLK